MEMNFRVATPAERNYTYTQSQQIAMQTGLVGYLRGDMDTDGQGFFTSWNGFRDSLKTQEFKDEFDSVINALRNDSQYDGVLKNRSSLSSYCYKHTDAAYSPTEYREFGFRADTDKHSYLLRLNPNRGEYNLYCYCYVKASLDKHMQNAERGIRFIDPHYQEQFRIPDGGKVLITTSTGEKLDRTCRYIDEYHVEVGSNLYHICEFAERMQGAKNTVAPLEVNSVQNKSSQSKRKDRDDAR